MNDAPVHLLPVHAVILKPGEDDDDGQIGLAPILEILGLAEIFEAAVQFACVEALVFRLDLRGQKLGADFSVLVPEFEKPVDAGFDLASLIEDEAHLSYQLARHGDALITDQLLRRDPFAVPAFRFGHSPAATFESAEK